MQRGASQHNAGFTLVEVLVAVSISLVVAAGMLTAFVWTLRTASECQQYAWAQTEAIQSSQRIVSYMRNATAITNLDVSGNWVELIMPPSNRVARFAYVNPGNRVGQGRLLFVADITRPNGPTNELAVGLTKVMTPPARNVFVQTGTNAMRVAYRVTKPSTLGTYPAEIDVGVRFRNN